MKHSTTIIAAAILAFGASAASAATLTINSVTGIWSDSTPGAPDISGLGTSSISWGEPLGSGQSGYDFVGTAPPSFDADEGVDFSLGTFTHRNNPILAPSLESVKLTVTTNILGVGDVVTVYEFDHWETPNSADPCADGGANGVGVNVNGCADRVTAVLNAAESETFTFGGVEYSLTIEGFQVGGSVLTDFWTKEAADNSALLIASFETTVIPVPASLPLLLAGMAGLGLMSRRNKKKAA